MDAVIRFEIPGQPIPQPRARATRAGRMYTPTTNGIGVFKQAISLVAASRARRAGWEFTATDAFEVEIDCVFSRPPSHLTPGGELRKSAPRHPGHSAGDWDNLAKGVADAITASGCVWKDDSQVVDGRCRKRYAGPGENAKVVVYVRRLG